MKVGNIVLADGKIGIICEKYCKTNQNFDWDVVFLSNNPPLGIHQDCYKEKELKLYNWKPYPKTIKECFKLMFKIIKKKV